MTKKETIWRYVVDASLHRREAVFTQQDLAAKFGYSLNTVFNALKVPRQIGAVQVTGRNFRVRDPEKLLLLWATVRNLQRDIMYRTHVNASVQRIEGLMPPDVTFAAYSAYRLTHGSSPADYDRVFVYARDLTELKKRFPARKGFANLIVLRPDTLMAQTLKVTADVQTYVDVWNLDDWFARDFLAALKDKLKF